MEPRLQNKTKENCQSNKREYAATFLFPTFSVYVFSFPSSVLLWFNNYLGFPQYMISYFFCLPFLKQVP
jgi:hypothetical protein